MAIGVNFMAAFLARIGRRGFGEVFVDVDEAGLDV